MSIRIIKKVESIRELKREIDKFEILDVETFKKNKERFYSSSMILFSMINDMLAIAEELVDLLGLEIPETYYQTFKILARERVIDDSEEKICIQLISLRNFLAHEYDNFTEKEVYELYLMRDSIFNIANKLFEKIKK